MDIADIMIHVHPDLPLSQREDIEEVVGSCEGVVSVHFCQENKHELTVAYDPKVMNSKTILEQVMQWDKNAMMVGL